MTNRDELIKKYNRRQLNESEKKEFDAFMESDADFATDVYLAAKLTAARHAKLQDNVADDSRKRVRRLWQYAGIVALLLIGIIIYFLRQNKVETPLKSAFDVPIVEERELKTPNSTAPEIGIKDTASIRFNKQGTYKIELKESKESEAKPQSTPSVKTPKNAPFSMDSNRWQVVIVELGENETLASGEQTTWKVQLFSREPQYSAALTTIRQATKETTNETMLNKYHLYGGILNTSLPEGNRQEGIEWLKTVIKNDYYADYAAEFLIKIYLELGLKKEAQQLLKKYPPVKKE